MSFVRPKSILAILLALQLGAAGATPFAPSAAFAKDKPKLSHSVDERRLIPAILKLKKGEQVPPSIYRKYDSRAIAESLVERYHRSLSLPKNKSDAGIDLLKYGVQHIYFKEADIASVLKMGFLNQHQVGKSNGILDPSFREQVENRFIGLKLESKYTQDQVNPVHFTRPTYGKLEIDLDQDLGFYTWNEATQYGQIVAVLRDEVKYRSTWTRDDSLSEKFRTHTFFEKPDQIFPKNEIYKSTNYLETQIWGEVDLRDVNYFMVSETVADPSIKMLKLAGLPIYQYSVERKHGQITRVPSEKLFSGDPAKMRQYARSRSKLRAAFRDKNPLITEFPIEHEGVITWRKCDADKLSRLLKKNAGMAP